MARDWDRFVVVGTNFFFSSYTGVSTCVNHADFGRL